jgi:hypothetical protein
VRSVRALGSTPSRRRHLVVVALVAACQAGAPTEGATEGPTATTIAPTSPPVTTGATETQASVVTVAFTQAIPPKRWGDPPFQAQAAASDDGPVTYSAEGGCSVDASSGEVTIASVGECTITATSKVAAAAATESFVIEPARPVISFGDRETRFARPFSYELGATVDPEIPLTYRVVEGHPQASENDEDCMVEDGTLVFSDEPISFENRPGIPLFCMIEVSAAGESPNFVTPEPVLGLVRIGFANWDVRVPPIDPVDWSDSGGTVTIPVNENSGDAFGIDVFQLAGIGTCEHVSTTPDPAPDATTRYEVTLSVSEPPAEGYTCDLVAEATPSDYQGGDPRDEFSLTVVP